VGMFKICVHIERKEKVISNDEKYYGQEIESGHDRLLQQIQAFDKLLQTVISFFFFFCG